MQVLRRPVVPMPIVNDWNLTSPDAYALWTRLVRCNPVLVYKDGREKRVVNDKEFSDKEILSTTNYR